MPLAPSRTGLEAPVAVRRRSALPRDEGTATPTQLQQKQPLAVSAIGDAKAETRHHTNFQ